jgi:hypothetical protein
MPRKGSYSAAMDQSVTHLRKSCWRREASEMLTDRPLERAGMKALQGTDRQDD